jgi:type III pantothenate kinase
MFLAVNVGNSNLHFGIFLNGRLHRAFDLSTPRAVLSAAGKRRLEKELDQRGKQAEWEGVWAATVVPRLRPALSSFLRKLTCRKVQWVTSLTPMPVKNAYRPPRSLGVDRLLNAVAATAEFGAPVIVVDAGTAFHVDAVDARGVFLGGAIWPGLALSLDSLHQGTALLPRIPLRKPATLLGRSTRQSLQAGLVGGTAGAVAALVAGQRQVVGARAALVGTGGGLEPGRLAIPGLRHVRPQLALWGLHRLWQASRARRGGQTA